MRITEDAESGSGPAPNAGSVGTPSDVHRLPVMVLVPAFNEEASVGQVVRDISDCGYPVTVVDDGSTDSTAERAAEAGATVLRLPVNLGVGAALRCGFRYALDHGYEIVVQCDGDGQHPPSQIRGLVEELERQSVHLVVGNRFAAMESITPAPFRRLVMRLLAIFTRRLCGTYINDSTSGFRAMRRPLLDDFARNYPSEYLGDTVEALITAARKGYKVGEAPVVITARVGGAPSASSFASAWSVVRVVAAVTLRATKRCDQVLTALQQPSPPNGRHMVQVDDARVSAAGSSES